MLKARDATFVVLHRRINSVRAFADGVEHGIQLGIHALLALFNASVNVPLSCSCASFYELFQVFK